MLCCFQSHHSQQGTICRGIDSSQGFVAVDDVPVVFGLGQAAGPGTALQLTSACAAAGRETTLKPSCMCITRVDEVHCLEQCLSWEELQGQVQPDDQSQQGCAASSPRASASRRRASRRHKGEQSDDGGQHKQPGCCRVAACSVTAVQAGVILNCLWHVLLIPQPWAQAKGQVGAHRKALSATLSVNTLGGCFVLDCPCDWCVAAWPSPLNSEQRSLSSPAVRDTTCVCFDMNPDVHRLCAF